MVKRGGVEGGKEGGQRREGKEKTGGIRLLRGRDYVLFLLFEGGYGRDAQVDSLLLW